MDNLNEHLPINDVLCVHDYSEGELQLEYFDVAKVSLHRTILYCHESMDGRASTEEDPHIVKEHLSVISDDDVQDYHAVHKAQELVKGYLKDSKNGHPQNAGVHRWLCGPIQVR